MAAPGAAPTETQPASTQAQGVAAFINKVWSILGNEEYAKLISWSEVRVWLAFVCVSRLRPRETFTGCALIRVLSPLAVWKERDSARLPELFQGDTASLLQTQQIQQFCAAAKSL